ncbi:MAG: zinc-binding dehydrogenase [Nitrospirae bacterium]|nr:zinc-binding dehydrogenase [Nitrospirota bacterium]
MKALFIESHGGPEVLRVGDLPAPGAAAGQALVRVRACGLNHLDVWIRQGLPNLKLTFPHVLGSDAAGVVESVNGDGAEGVAPGARVVVYPGLSCGRCRACHSGQDDMCSKFHLMGEHVSGGCAELVAVPLRNLWVLPEAISFVQAACLPVAYVTAWHMVACRGRVEPDEWVLVTAAASGVSSAAIQIAKMYRARVIAAASSERKLTLAKELGADEVVDYSRPDWAREVKRITGGEGVQVILDHVGASKWEDYVRLLSKGGRIVICGASSGYDAKTDLRHVFFRRLSIIGSTMGSLSDFGRVVEAVAKGRIRPVIHKTLPLEQAREAHRVLEEKEVLGKVVIEIG